MFDNITGLRIVNAGLAATLRKMKHEERGLRGQSRWRRSAEQDANVPLAQRHLIYCHRKREVEPAMRASYLAHAFLRGMDLRRVENDARSRPKWDMVETIIMRHCGSQDTRVVAQRLAEWIDNAKLHRTVAPRPSKEQRSLSSTVEQAPDER